MKTFHVYLANRKFYICTDHKPITGSNFAKDTNNTRLIRWALILQEYDCEIIYRPGRQMLLPDYLSRHPVGEPVNIEYDLPSLAIVMSDMKDLQQEDPF